MSGWVAGAVVVGTVAGAAISADAAKDASRTAAAANDASLAFEYEKYDDWQATYGSIQDNLSDYYQNLTPEYYAAVGLEAFNQEQQASMTRVEQSLAQRGLADSSLATSIEAQSELDAAETRAGIRRDAPAQARQEQSNFLSMGLGVNPGNSVSAALQSQANTATQYAQQSEIAAGQAIGTAVSSVGSAASDYFRANPVTTGTTTAVNYQVPATNPTVGYV